MKKVILLIALSVLLYAAPGNAMHGGGVDKAAKAPEWAKRAAEERAAEERAAWQAAPGKRCHVKASVLLKAYAAEVKEVKEEWYKVMAAAELAKLADPVKGAVGEVGAEVEAALVAAEAALADPVKAALAALAAAAKDKAIAAIVVLAKATEAEAALADPAVAAFKAAFKAALADPTDPTATAEAAEAVVALASLGRPAEGVAAPASSLRKLAPRAQEPEEEAPAD